MRFSEEHIRMIRESLPNEVPGKSFDKFIFNAERLELDPLLGQIQLISRRSKDDRDQWHVTWQTLLGRDSYRILADRTGELDGSDTIPHFDLTTGALVSATCTVWRKDKSHYFSETVYLAEYMAEKSPFWKSKPITMLGKVAEAQALRKAFPSLLTGTYAIEEFDAPLDREAEERVSPPSTAPATEMEKKAARAKAEPMPAGMHKALEAQITKTGLDRALVKQYVAEIGWLELSVSGPHLTDLSATHGSYILGNWDRFSAALGKWERDQLRHEVDPAEKPSLPNPPPWDAVDDGDP